MTEKYDFDANNKPTWFNHLLLASEASKLTKDASFDSSKLDVKLEINGVEVLVADFNEILEEWSDRIASQIKEKTVVENAESLLKEKLGDAFELLQAIEDSAWKLRD